MRYQVPQFIEVEDKIFGPLTLKQFIYIAGGCGLAFVFFRFLPFIIAVLPMAASVIFGLALAFYKDRVSGKPFIDVVEASFKYVLSSKLYIWRKATPSATQKPKENKETEIADAFINQSVSQSTMKTLSENLD